MSFGDQTLTFVSETASGTRDELGLPGKTPSEVDVEGCRFRLFSRGETAEGTYDVAKEVWKGTCPPDAAALGAKPNGKVKALVNGVVTTFRIDGPVKPHPGRGGWHHVSVWARRTTA